MPPKLLSFTDILTATDRNLHEALVRWFQERGIVLVRRDMRPPDHVGQEQDESGDGK